MSDKYSGIAELRDTRRQLLGLFLLAGLFSIFVNLLMLTGPLFMLQTYDRVLTSRSEPTLITLMALMAFLFLVLGLVDWTRGRIMARLGARFQHRLDRRVFDAMLRYSVVDKSVNESTGSGQQLKDLEALHRFYASPVFTALFDAPWAPVFLLGIGLIHPWLGLFAAFGGTVLLLSALMNQLTTKVPSVKAAVSGYVSDRYADELRNEAETIRSLGMQTHAFEKWAKSRARALSLNLRASDLGGSFSTLSRVFRLFLQSAMLGLGAYLVLRGEIGPGVMIASSILLGRALQPVETIVNQWPQVQRARRAQENIVTLLSDVPVEGRQLDLPRPRGKLEVQGITVVPPRGSVPTLRQISFSVEPGEAVAVIGPSGAGKSTLARALTGVWPLNAGKIRLDGAPISQYHPEKLAHYIGYLPQRVSLFDGTIAENIARLQFDYDSDQVIDAARRAAAHDMILHLPQGYNTPIRSVSTELSGGQIQRIGLARALFGDPVLLILDEPNSNLDNEGSRALNQAICDMKERGNVVLVMAHRPSAIKECDKVLVIEDGQLRAWGPREEVMSKMLSNVQVIRKATATANAGLA
ncbi:type I secretion system permease/ATPase [Pseudooceanicola nanhaiensis]|uniref:type I secretion system permease/ATPase n=1 Tax=Pseudooceanicola nanhaiensis TaxID=375761 RepID=UPI001CD7F0B1|nr:type I secretion system permease/ATPase [Pseudooceanicola nanhaiensis]MCA0920206.1 type I secretion system permease/ATPase [Pseudooceanicola nanhaiensis]